MAHQSSGKKPGRSAPDQRRKLIDEFIMLDQEVDAFKHKQFRHQKLRELILGWHPLLSPDERAVLTGTDSDILISSRDKIRSVTPMGKQRLYKLWGPREFISRCVVFLKSLPDPKDEDGLYSAEALTGPRHLQVIEKAQKLIPVPPAKPAAAAPKKRTAA